MRIRSAATVLAVVLAAACKDSTPPLVATSIVASVTTISFDAIGASQTVTIAVHDQNGAVMTGVTATWTSSAPAIATVTGGATATVVATGNGAGSVLALAGKAQVLIPVSVTQLPVAPQKIAGDAQTATVGTALSAQLRVRVQDRLGNAIAGTPVAFAVAAGSGTVLPASVTSAADGMALATWTLGTVPGAQTLTVTAQGAPAAATFAATATVGAPAIVAVSAGNSQTAIVGAAIVTPPAVRVADAFDNPVPGASVVFAVAAGGGTVTGGAATTNASGIATVGSWTLGTTAGAKSMTATVAGLTPISFTATAVAGPAAAIVVSAGNNQTAIAGAAVVTPPAVRVADAFNNPVPGASVVFAVAAGGGTVTGGAATTNASGIATVGSWRLGTTAGANSMTATVAGLAPVSFTATAVAGPAAAVVVSAGAGQTGFVLSPLATPPAVRVNDINGNPVAGVAVTFAVATGNGSATGTNAVTSVGGIATVGSWTMGAVAGTNTLTATVAGSGITGNPVTFTASAIATGGGGGGGGGGSTGFRIELRYLTAGSAAQVSAFDAAATRWQNIITAKLVDTPLNIVAAQCGANAPAVNETIDDLVIFVTFAAIDGVGGTLGSAGPCYVRGASGLPILGQMRFDTADLATMEANGTLNSVILHEMGHVLGIGTMWDLPGFFSFLANPSLPSSPGVDTRYTGANGTAGFNLIGGATYTGGGKVPVENTQGGEGTRDSHWRESVLLNELMTGFVSSSGTNPLSMLTLRSLQDFGYTVNTAQADAFFLTLTAAAIQAQPGTMTPLGDDVIRVPIVVVDDRGQPTRVVRPRRP